MKNNYIELVLTAKNEFRAEASFRINGMDLTESVIFLLEWIFYKNWKHI